MKRSDVPEVAVLRAYRDYRADVDRALAGRPVFVMLEPGWPRIARPWERVAAAGFPYKVVMARIMQLDDKGLLDYGVSLQVGWLTEAEKARLRELEEN